MYKNLLKLFIYLPQIFLVYVLQRLGADDYAYQSVVDPVSALAIAQLGLSGVKYFTEKAEQRTINNDLRKLEKRLDDIQFTNRLKALTVPENISMKEDIQRNRNQVSEQLTEQMGTRGVLGGMSKADQASTNAMLKLTEQERKNQFLADSKVMENQQRIDNLNVNRDLKEEYMRAAGLQTALAESKSEQPTAQDLLAGLGTFAAAQMSTQNQTGQSNLNNLDKMLKRGQITQAEYNQMRQNIIKNVGATNPYTVNPGLMAQNPNVVNPTLGTQTQPSTTNPVEISLSFADDTRSAKWGQQEVDDFKLWQQSNPGKGLDEYFALFPDLIGKEGRMKAPIEE